MDTTIQSWSQFKHEYSTTHPHSTLTDISKAWKEYKAALVEEDDILYADNYRYYTNKGILVLDYIQRNTNTQPSNVTKLVSNNNGLPYTLAIPQYEEDTLKLFMYVEKNDIPTAVVCANYINNILREEWLQECS